MTVTAAHSREGLPLVGGYGPAQAAKEALTRDLSAELAPQGIRVVGLRPYAMPETPTIRDAFEPRREASGMTWEQWQEMLASRTHPRRLMTVTSRSLGRRAQAMDGMDMGVATELGSFGSNVGLWGDDDGRDDAAVGDWPRRMTRRHDGMRHARLGIAPARDRGRGRPPWFADV